MKAASGRPPGDALAARAVDDRLIDELADLVVDRVADVVAERIVPLLDSMAQGRAEGLVDALEIARITGRSRWWVYEHARELGAVRLGPGPRPRLGFAPSQVDVYLKASAELRQPTPPPARAQQKRRRRAGRTSTGVELLPIAGRRA